MKFPRERFFWIGFSIVLIIVIIVLFVNSMNFRRAAQDKQKELKGEIKDLKEALMDCNNRLRYVPTIDMGDIERLQAYGLQDPLTDIPDNLKKHTELIPYDAVLGGTMQFSNIHILTPRWLFACFDDGHIEGCILLEYKVSYEGDITWKVKDSYLD